ncbi:hypothetical protein GOP47_0017429 [Adiantum capillus-veneris]|uniref:Peroxisomal membrane protein PEX14 n=1 Tax=Adiantum capillus-veneris TaxID=13818 RepID=A0A9D4UGJ8_ADICA|nr:hypothetical protein GOP47_0017429 [Adiantum capillus-veneris]
MKETPPDETGQRGGAMADTAAPALVPSQPDAASSDEVKLSPESKEKPSIPEKWPFSEPQPIREDQVRNAVNFLSHPNVRGTPMVQRFSFLERKGLTREEIEEAFRQCPDPPTSEATKSLARIEGRVPAQPSQAQSGGYHQSLVSTQPQPAYQYASGPPSLIVPARSGSNWSQLILGASLIAAAGVGTGYFFQKVLAPKVRMWLRDMILQEKRPIDSIQELHGKGPKLTPLEEAVNAAAAAANAAAAAAAEVANTSREVLKLQAEEWQQFRSSIKNLDSKTEELRGTLTLLSKNFHDAEERAGSAVPVHAEEASYYKGTAKPYQRTQSPAEQMQIKQGTQAIQQSVNGVDNIHSNGTSTNVSGYLSQSDDEPWWRRKKVEVETYTSPKQHVESTLQISEGEGDLDQEIGSTGRRAGTQNRGGPLGRQGWVPPPVPQTVMPGAASAIRYQKPTTADEAKRAYLSEEKEVDLRQDSSSSMRLQNPVKMDEAAVPKVVAEDPANADGAKPRVVVEEKPSASWYPKPVTLDGAQRAFILDEKEFGSHQPQPLLETGSSDFSSPLRLQNPVKVDGKPKIVAENSAFVDETKRSVLSEEKEITTQTSFDLPNMSAEATFERPKMPEVVEITAEQPKMSEVVEITSIDKEIPPSSTEDFTGDVA